MRRRGALALAGVLGTGLLVYDPRAAAADVKRAALLLIGMGALVLLPRAANVRPGLPVPALLWLLLVLWSALRSIGSHPLGLPLLGTWVGGSAVLLAALKLPRCEARRAARLLATGLGGGAALWAGIDYAAGRRGLFLHGGQGNPNWLGLLVAIALPLAVEQALILRARRSRLWAAGAMGVLLQGAALYLSHSRVAWLAVGVAALPLLRRGRSGVALLRAGVAGVLLIVLMGALLVRAAPAALSDAEDLEEGAVIGAHDVPLLVALDGRAWIARVSLGAAKRALPLGAGPGRFASAYLDEQGRRLQDFGPRAAARRFQNATTAHNDWLEVAVESGAMGLALLVAAVSSALFACRRRGGRTRWGVGWGAQGASLLALVVCMSGDSPLQQPAIVALFALLLAAMPRTPRSGAAAVRGLGGVVLLGAALLLAPAVSTWLGERLLSAARHADPVQRAVLLERAARLDPRSGELALERGLDALLQGDAEAALPELRRSRGLLANVGTEVAIGNAELLLGRDAAAADSYRRALRLHPGSFRAHANLAVALGRLGDLPRAQAHLWIARSLSPGHQKLAAMEQKLTEQAAEQAAEQATAHEAGPSPGPR